LNERTVSYHLDDEGRFVVEEYNWAAPFSNFFPGIAGRWGIPLWAYYVSRAQAVVSLGVRDKDHQILEFQSFNRACQAVPHEGYRTFVRLDAARPLEPFQRTDRPAVTQRLIMSAGELELQEVDAEAQLETTVVYFPLVNVPIAGMVRLLTLRNTGARTRRVECLDGVPRVLPYGMDQQHVKHIARHVEAMMGVAFVGGVPLFRLKQTAADREHVERLSGGNFYLGLDGSGLRGERLLVDPAPLFGDPMQHLVPWGFHRHDLDALLGQPQLHENTTPCAFTAAAADLAPGAALTVTSVLGNAADDAKLAAFVRQVVDPSFVAAKRRENRAVLEEITDRAFTASAEPVFDLASGQTFLDNAMRGGLPAVFSGPRGRKVFYLYCRQNGDLERDYHYFVLEPTYLSQGTGHYRSIFQNRRTDVWFFPAIEDVNVTWFMNLLQLDGYNPLEVRGLSYLATDRDAAGEVLDGVVRDPGVRARLLELVTRPFTPGELVMAVEAATGHAGVDYDALLGQLLPVCEEQELGGLHEGFWVDHWHYNLDAVETYLMIYPDRLRELLLGRRDYTFFDDPDVVLPRRLKTVLRGDGQVRRYGAVARDEDKLTLCQARFEHPFRVRTRHGAGEVYRTTLVVKLLGLLANRVATLDPAGTGVDMEADKPGWNDSMNGLPALFGSSLCETLELERLARFLAQSLAALAPAEVAVYEELADLVTGLDAALARRASRHDPEAAFVFWEESNTLKETYRERTRDGISGAERPMTGATLATFVDRCVALLAALFHPEARHAVTSPDGVPYTYFVNEVTAFERTGEHTLHGLPLVRPTCFRQRPVRLFLEGPVHYLKVHPEQAREVYAAVRRSPLYDERLGMYKSCENMEGESFELGRAVGAYPRGWLENESIYLHMEYKYLLEVLRSGLCEEFYRDARTALVPFMDPAVYGRSTLEGASFIVSSAYADATLHGRGFQPRLSGTTCELLHIWLLMVAGPEPFSVDEQGELRFALRPALADWLFTTAPRRCTYRDEARGPVELEVPADAFAFKLFGSTLVVYHNAARRPTYGPGAATVVEYRLTLRDGSRQAVTGAHLGPAPARAVRQGEVARIDAILQP
jgi:hypothetical protein